MSGTIFLSYARGDDELFVVRLYADLTARGFDVWWDRVSMPARGLTFLHEIRDAIDARERLLLVLGPKATTSDYVIAEWQHAVTYGKAINPVLRHGDFPLVPDELKLFHIEDFRDDIGYASHLENLVRQLSERVAPMGKLVAVPSLPRRPLTRPENLQSLKDSLLSDLQRPVVVTGVAARVGMHGMGGIGKSVLANMLAHDTEVRRAFPDGIFWVPLGTEPNLVELQQNIARMFDDRSYFESVVQGRAKLGELLASKAVLLVLDDVWERTHAEAFNVLGPRCRAVITTRDAGLVISLGCTQHQVQLLTEAESLPLLAGASGVNADELPPEAKNIVSECGGLPLAVALCAGMVKRGVSWASILARLQECALESIGDRNAENAQHRSLWTALKISLDVLTSNEQQRFIELCVFPSGEAVPEAAVFRLWSHTGHLDEFACEDLLLSLSERNLLRIDTEPPQAGQASRFRVSLHDLLHDFASKLAGDAAPLHSQVLEAYRELCPNGWPSGPNDGYFLEHLCSHFAEARQFDELHKVLFDFNWLQIKTEKLPVYAAIRDYDEGLRAIPTDDPQRRPLERVRDAIRLSSHVIAGEKNQLASQLVGRMLHFEEPEIKHLVKDASSWRSAPWLKPLTGGLYPPGFGLLRTFSGHTDYVRCVVVLSDGKHVLSAGHDGFIRLWDLNTGTEIHQIKTDPHCYVGQVAALPDGNRALSVSATDLTFSLWDLIHNVEISCFDAMDIAPVMAVTPDGRSVLSSYYMFDLRLWDLETGAELRCLEGGAAAVTSVAIAPDGRQGISGAKDMTVRLWDLETGAELRCLTGHTDEVTSVAFAPEGRRGISGAKDKTVRLWDLETGAELGCLRGHTDEVTSVAIAPDGRRAISGSKDRTVRLWDLVTGAELRRFGAHNAEVTSVAVVSDGRRAVSASADTTVRVWDLDWGGEMRPNPEQHSGRVTSIVVTSDGQHAFSGSEDNTCYLWDLRTRRTLRQFISANGGVSGVAVTLDGWGVSSALDGCLCLWDLHDGRQARRLKGPNDQVETLSVTPNGKVALCCSRKTGYFWDLNTGEELLRVEAPGETWFAGALILPDQRRALFAINDNSGINRHLCLWNISRRTVIRRFEFRGYSPDSMVLTGDRQRIVSVFGLDTILVWDLETGILIRQFVVDTLRPHVTIGAVTPDDAAVLFSRHLNYSNDTAVRLWDLKNASEICAFIPDAEITCCAAVDRRTLVAGDSSGRVHFLRLVLQEDPADPSFQCQ